MSDYDGTENPETPWRDDGETEDDNRGDDGLTGGDRTPYGPNPDERGTELSAIVGLLGLALIAQALVLELVATQFWNDIFVGATLLVAGGYNYYRRSNEEFGSIGVASLVALLGLWLVASPFLLGSGSGIAETASDLGIWTDIIVGLLAFGIGSYSAYVIRDRRRHVDVRRTAT
ncbi:SPW repeat protein [Natrinema zhouii]|uniref:SPW repeat protein n=1 Tax=Natrinema zhouii TaxID=1710539 RepID=A0A7D6GKV4_9EURY|nr:SPW repeat protein [Natrinema zhouii]QLK26560.1 SPW repeat protein [Natrinema zhouii]